MWMDESLLFSGDNGEQSSCADYLPWSQQAHDLKLAVLSENESREYFNGLVRQCLLNAVNIPA